MLACLWPWATALGNGSVLETHSLFTEFVLKTHSLQRNEVTLFLGAKKFLLVPPKWGKEGQDPVQFSMWKPRCDSQQSSFFGAIEQGKWLIHFCSTPVSLSDTHMLHCPGLCCPGLKWLWFLIYWHINNGWKWVSPSFFSALSSRTVFWLGGYGDWFCLVKDQFLIILLMFLICMWRMTFECNANLWVQYSVSSPALVKMEVWEVDDEFTEALLGGGWGSWLWMGRILWVFFFKAFLFCFFSFRSFSNQFLHETFAYCA